LKRALRYAIKNVAKQITRRLNNNNKPIKKRVYRSRLVFNRTLESIYNFCLNKADKNVVPVEPVVKIVKIRVPRVKKVKPVVIVEE
jgi:hypothetical protein